MKNLVLWQPLEPFDIGQGNQKAYTKHSLSSYRGDESGDGETSWKKKPELGGRRRRWTRELAAVGEAVGPKWPEVA